MRALRVPSLVVLVAVLALLGPPAVASASDAGLRKVVTRDIAAWKRLAAAERRMAAAPAPTTFRGYVRCLRRGANYYARVQRRAAGLRRRYLRERPETRQAARGRTLLVRGHRDFATGAHATVVGVRRGVREMSAARTERSFLRAQRRMGRVLVAQGARMRRGQSRVTRGRNLVREAPAPPTAVPSPGAPTPSPAPAPTPAPTTPSPSAPAPLLPGLSSLLPGLLGG